MLSEAHRRQITCSNDTAYVGSRPPFSARASNSVQESREAPDEREGGLRRFVSIVCCVRIAVALSSSQNPGEQQQQRPRGILPLQRAARTARGRAVWSNHAEHGGMACHDDIPCALGDSSSHEELRRPVEAVLRSMRKQEIAQIKLWKPDVHPASRGTPQNHTHPTPSPPGGKTGPGVRPLGHLVPY